MGQVSPEIMYFEIMQGFEIVLELLVPALMVMIDCAAECLGQSY